MRGSRRGYLYQDSTGGQGLHPPKKLLLVGAPHAGVCPGELVHDSPWTPNDTLLACQCGPHVLWDVEVGEHTLGMSIPALVLPTATDTHTGSLYVLVASWPYCLDMQGILSSLLAGFVVDPAVHLQLQDRPSYEGVFSVV